MARSSAAARRTSACWGVSTTGLLFVVRGNITGRSPRTPPLWPGAMTRPGFFSLVPHPRPASVDSLRGVLPCQTPGAPTSSREEPHVAGPAAPGASAAPLPDAGDCRVDLGQWRAHGPRPLAWKKTFSRFQGFAVRADLRGSDNRRDRLSLSRLLEM
ncbi:Uncharacterised protein [Mycobacteroides abscessus subsp. abscessus]|nr:Uncharacterised protein [Mycobacteroides abscessus subsp. abscessus]